ncbi:MAG TPA: MaoC family dehydratase N-terminal domain-containing protein [Rhizomicrobium sp.]
MSETRSLHDLLGRTDIVTDIASPVPLLGLAALLDYDAPPWDGVPPLGHWLYFLNSARQSALGPDGHPKRGDADVLPRRMWAGSRITFHAPIRIGALLEKRSTVASVADKSGASGAMTFVTLHHEIEADGKLAIREEQDVVYRAASGEAPKSTSAMPTPTWQRSVTPDETQLFRFSALTFNAHRIHYDKDYARDIEGYPALVVQGPYTATLLMDLALRYGPPPSRFSFRARRPHFAGRVLNLCGEGGRLWSTDEAGQVGMTAEIG